MRGWRKGSASAVSASGDMVAYRGYDLLPDVRMIAEGELFAGTWIIDRCSFGRAVTGGYEVRSLSGDNDHFATRSEARVTAVTRAMRTIDAGEVGALHLSPVPSPDSHAGRR